MRTFRKLPPVLDGFPDYSPKVIPKENLTPEQWRLKRECEVERERFVPMFREGETELDGLRLPYRFFVPGVDDETKKYPLVVFFHGGGERGADNVLQLTANDGACVWVREQLAGRLEQCFVLAPQCPDGERGFLERHLLVISEMLDGLCADYPIDEERIYVTGLSMGGGGCWRFQYMYPDRFAAMLALCCAACTVENKRVDEPSVRSAAEAFEHTPVWLVQAADDPAVNPECPRTFFGILQSMVSPPRPDDRYTEYPADLGYKHNVWDAAYADGEMRSWLFSQRLRADNTYTEKEN